MKKVLISIAIVAVTATMVSCGSKNAQGGDNDSTAVAIMEDFAREHGISYEETEPA